MTLKSHPSRVKLAAKIVPKTWRTPWTQRSVKLHGEIPYRQRWHDDGFVEFEDPDATSWHDPEEFDHDESWSDNYFESHHELASVDEDDKYQGSEDQVFDVVDNGEILATYVDARD